MPLSALILGSTPFIIGAGALVMAYFDVHSLDKK